jgi:hypothetical protein
MTNKRTVIASTFGICCLAALATIYIGLARHRSGVRQTRVVSSAGVPIPSLLLRAENEPGL